MARYLGVIKKAARKFDRVQREREEAVAEELRHHAEAESEREELRGQQAQKLNELADKFERTVGDIVGGVAAASSQLQATASSMASASVAVSSRAIPRSGIRDRRTEPGLASEPAACET